MIGWPQVRHCPPRFCRDKLQGAAPVRGRFILSRCVRLQEKHPLRVQFPEWSIMRLSRPPEGEFRQFCRTLVNRVEHKPSASRPIVACERLNNAGTSNERALPNHRLEGHRSELGLYRGSAEHEGQDQGRKNAEHQPRPPEVGHAHHLVCPTRRITRGGRGGRSGLRDARAGRRRVHADVSHQTANARPGDRELHANRQQPSRARRRPDSRECRGNARSGIGVRHDALLGWLQETPGRCLQRNQRQRGTHRPVPNAAPHTMNRPSRCRRTPQGESRAFSLGPILDSPLDIFPRNRLGFPTVDLIKASIELLAVGWRQRQRSGAAAKALPQSLDETKAFLRRHPFDIDGWAAHAAIVSPRRCLDKPFLLYQRAA